MRMFGEAGGWEQAPVAPPVPDEPQSLAGGVGG